MVAFSIVVLAGAAACFTSQPTLPAQLPQLSMELSCRPWIAS
jgi:hypothetical protein